MLTQKRRRTGDKKSSEERLRKENEGDKVKAGDDDETETNYNDTITYKKTLDVKRAKIGKENGFKEPA